MAVARDLRLVMMAAARYLRLVLVAASTMASAVVPRTAARKVALVVTAMRALQCGGVRMATLPEDEEEASVSTTAVRRHETKILFRAIE